MESNNEPRISVCIATFNGGDYIEEQLLSILNQIGESDEVVIVDDGSTDDTVSTILKLQDHRIKLTAHTLNRGYVRTFEDSITLARGSVIMLSDQDDMWPPGRVNKILNAFENANTDVIVGKFSYMFGSLPPPYSSSFRKANDNCGLVNLAWWFAGRLPFYGCCIAFKAEIRPSLIPFSCDAIGHDHALAIYSNVHDSVYFLDEAIVLRRLHSSNLTSSNRSIPQKLISRVRFLRVVLRHYRRRIKIRCEFKKVYERP